MKLKNKDVKIQIKKKTNKRKIKLKAQRAMANLYTNLKKLKT